MRIPKSNKNKKEKDSKLINSKSSLRNNNNSGKRNVSGETEFIASENDPELIDDYEAEESENESLFLDEVSKFETEHQKTKLINLFKLIGKPKLKKAADIDNRIIKDEYIRLIALLDEKRIIVHFKNEYPVREKYRFITEEIFKQDVEDLSNTHLHINFIYEDFHPEMDDEEEY